MKVSRNDCYKKKKKIFVVFEVVKLYEEFEEVEADSIDYICTYMYVPY